MHSGLRLTIHKGNRFDTQIQRSDMGLCARTIHGARRPIGAVHRRGYRWRPRGVARTEKVVWLFVSPDSQRGRKVLQRSGGLG